MTTAYTRAVSPLLADCALTHIGRSAIDPVRAAAQHAAYEAALRQADLRVVRLPELPDCPDGVFVEDTALLLDGHAIITRPGAASRVAETASTAAGLASAFTVHHLPQGTLDGGDVLRIGRTLYCGRSARTDAAGATALATLAAPLGFTVITVKVTGCLHLKTGATYLGENDAGRPVLLCNPAWVDAACFAGFTHLHTAPGEDFAANTLRAGSTVFAAAGAPATAARMAAQGFIMRALDISELQKAEAGLTCLSLIG